MLWEKGQLDYQAENSLINANLLDFSHLGYVHRNSFGADERWGALRPHIERLSNGVRVSWLVNAQIMVAPGEAAPRPFDLWSRYDYLVPGILIMEGRAYAADTTRPGANGEAPAAAVAFIDYHGQAVTALTHHTSRYFFAWGLSRSEPEAEKAIEGRFAMANAAFGEDRAMIEAQAQVIERDAARRRFVPTSADRAITIFESLMRRRSGAPESDASRATGRVAQPLGG